MWLGISFSSTASIVQIEQDEIATSNLLQTTSPFIVADTTPKLYVSAGIGRNIVVNIKDGANTIQTINFDGVASDDIFNIDNVTYQGVVITLEALNPGSYTVELTILNGTKLLSLNEYDLIIDNTAPQILGDFEYKIDGGVGIYYDFTDDGTLILARTAIFWMGYSDFIAGAGGVSHATFSSTYLDGPLQGTFHAKEQSVTIDQNNLIVGDRNRGSVSSAYIPSNTKAKMRFDYTIHGLNGLSSTRSFDSYVATGYSTTPPEPYALFTDVNSNLDNILAFKGFEKYVPGMLVTSNPVRMLYRVPRAEYYGGGGDADIYGTWIKYSGNNRRNKDFLLHSDESYLYFDLTATTSGKELNSISVSAADFSSYRRFIFKHELTLSEGAKPPVATSLSYMRASTGIWISSKNNNLSTNITKEDTNYQNDEITQVRIQVEARPYKQQFNFYFRVNNLPVNQNCVIEIAQTECIIATNLPYPGDDINVYHNRHRIRDLANGNYSDEIVSVWQYDGAPAEYDITQTIFDSFKRQVSLTFTKPYATRVWSQYNILSVKPFAVPINKVLGDPLTYEAPENQRIYLNKISENKIQLDDINYHKGLYDYSALSEGKYLIYAYVEDGKNSNNKHTNIHYIDSTLVPDTKPPTIYLNIKNGDLVQSIVSLSVNLSDVSDSEVTEFKISGGPDNINMVLPIVRVDRDTFRADYVHLVLSDGKNYTLTVKAKDEFNNQSMLSVDFDYMPRIASLPKMDLVAISSPLRSTNGTPYNVILTPQIKDEFNKLARGVHDVFFTLLPTATASFVVENQQVNPGETISFQQNISATQNRLRIVIYPKETGLVTESDFSIHIPAIKIALCPTDFKETSGNKCTFLDVKSSLAQCSEPFTLDGANCVYEVQYMPSDSCLPGYDRNDLTCSGSYTTTQISTCPTSYGLKDSDTCVKHSTVQAKTCETGKTLENNMCTDGQNFEPIGLYCDGQDMEQGQYCDATKCMDYISEWNACDVTVSVPAEKICPLGMSDGSQCKVEHEYEINAACPFGYSRDGLNCTKLEIIPAYKQCESGWDLSSDQSLCVKTVFAEFTSCPVNFTLTNGRCHPIKDVTITCPATFTWNGSSCHRTVITAATPECPVDYTWNGSQCAKPESAQATAVCPVNYTWSELGSRCEFYQEHDATPICKAGSLWSTSTNQCEEILTKPALPICGVGEVWNGSNCQLDETIPATPFCENDYFWDGNDCVGVETIAATYVNKCPAGTVDTGSDCQTSTPESQSATVTYTCPDDTWLLSGTNCSQEVPVSKPANSSLSCPDSSWSLNGSTCEKSTTNAQAATSNYSCPEGWTLFGKNCSKTSTSIQPAEINYSCPIGWTVSGASCNQTITSTQGATPSYSCPVDWTLSGSMCSKTTISALLANYSQSCPINYNLINTSWGYVCMSESGIGTVPVTFTMYCADSSYTLEDGLCKKSVTDTQVATATYSCPDSSWSLSGSMCSKLVTNTQDATMSYYCPSPKMVLTGNTCTRTTTSYQPATFTYTCPSDSWVLSGSTCIEEIVQSQAAVVSLYCEPNWVLTGTVCESTNTNNQTAIPIYSCADSSWTLSGTTCNRTSVTTQPYESGSYICPSVGGWTLSGQECQRPKTSVIVNWSCPTNWNVNGQLCEKTTINPPTSWSCDSPWALAGTMCEQIITSVPSSYSCASPYSLNATKCSWLQTSPEDYYQCPEGWLLSETQCNRTLYQPVDGYYCSDLGANLEGQQCSLGEDTGETRSCESNWTMTNPNTCQRDVPSDYVGLCDVGWSPLATECSQKSSQSVIYYCDIDFNLDANQCKRVLTEAVAVNCNDGELSENGMCLIEELSPVTRTCDAPYVKTGTFDCKNSVIIDNFDQL